MMLVLAADLHPDTRFLGLILHMSVLNHPVTEVRHMKNSTKIGFVNLVIVFTISATLPYLDRGTAVERETMYRQYTPGS